MTVSRHLEEAAERLQRASALINQVRNGPVNCENQNQWLGALTDYCQALADIQTFNNESIHEKLHELAGLVGLKKFRSSG
ncbi:hypothetical protein [Petrachloros mirabilis]